MENNLGLNIEELNGGEVVYENRKFTGAIRTIARLVKDGKVVSVSYVKGADNNLQAYLSLAQRLAGKDNETDTLAENTRKLLSLGMTQVSVAEQLGKACAYINQVVMLYKLNIQK